MNYLNFSTTIQAGQPLIHNLKALFTIVACILHALYPLTISERASNIDHSKLIVHLCLDCKAVSTCLINFHRYYKENYD